MKKNAGKNLQASGCKENRALGRGMSGLCEGFSGEARDRLVYRLFCSSLPYSLLPNADGAGLLLLLLVMPERALVLREKGTNRSRFFRGEVDKYTWVDLGSSYLRTCWPRFFMRNWKPERVFKKNAGESGSDTMNA